MDRVFKRLVEQTTPKANPYIMNGLASHYMPYALWYIDHVFRSASGSFPPGLEYIGCQKCSPEEHYWEITKPKNNKRTYDLAKSDLFMAKFNFKYNGEALAPRTLLLPFVRRGGILHLSGTKYHISPVMADKVFSPAHDHIFVRLLRDKIIFRRMYHTIKINSISTNCQVVWSQIYRKKTNAAKNIPITTKANTCMVHYLLGKYGFSKMCEKFLGFVPIVGEHEINPINFPEDQWTIFESTGFKPDSHCGEFYSPTKCRMAVPNEKMSADTTALLAGVFYVIDHFPHLFKQQHKDDTTIWRIMMGHILFSGVFGEALLYDDVSEHFNNLDKCLDSIIISELAAIGHSVKDFYDLLALVIMNFNNWLLTSSSNNNNSLEGKKLDILYYTLLTVTSAIFRAVFALSKTAAKKPLSAKDVTDLLTKHIGTGAIYKLTSPNISMSTVSYSGDNLYPKVTALVAEQESGPDANPGGSKRVVLGSRHRIHPTSAMYGSLHFLSKSNPTPNIHANMYMDMDLQSGSLKPHPEFVKLIEETAAKLEVNGYTDPEVTVFEEDDTESD